MPAAHFQPRHRSRPAGDPNFAPPPPAPSEPLGLGGVLWLVGFWLLVIGGPLATVLDSGVLVVVTAVLFLALITAPAFLGRGGSPDTVGEARATADEVVSELREPRARAVPPVPPLARGEPEPADVRAAPAAPASPAAPALPLPEQPVALADVGTLVAAKVEERLNALLATLERRDRRTQWMFFLLGIPVGFIVNWASAHLGG